MTTEDEHQETCRIEFEVGHHRTTFLARGSSLVRELTSLNSPILFGCRAGVCGTCLCEVTPLEDTTLEPAGDVELDTLEALAPKNPKARLVCQLTACGPMRLKPID